MPFPVAHPIAVLPLRRWCPDRLSFIGLVVGSLTPDAGYTLRHLDFQSFSHSLAGSFVFCLPIGLIAAFIVFFVRKSLAGTLPSPHREALLPLCAGAIPPGWRLAVSILIGAWTHIAFDGLTHESALHARSVETLQATVAGVEQAGLKFYQVIWMMVSSTSMALLGLFYLRFLKRSTGQIRLFDPNDRRRVLLWGGLVAVPYLLVAPFSYHLFEPGGPTIDKHTIYSSLAPYLLLFTGSVVSLGFALRHRDSRNHSALTPPAATASSDNPAPPG